MELQQSWCDFFFNLHKTLAIMKYNIKTGTKIHISTLYCGDIQHI